MNILSLEDLPFVSLIKGTLSEERKSSLITDICDKYKISAYDTKIVETLTVEASEEIKEFTQTEPLVSLKLVVIYLSHSVARAQNSLLTLLENPPSRVKFIIFSNSTTLSTLESRSQVFYETSKPAPPTQAKSLVMLALEATSGLDEVKLEVALKNWDDNCQALLFEWAIESKLSKPSSFSLEDLQKFKFPKGFEENLIMALSVLDAARPRLSAKSILLSYIEKSKG